MIYMLCFSYMLESILGSGEAAGVAFAISAIPLVTVGLLLGSLITYLIMRSRKLNRLNRPMKETTTTGPVYEDVYPPKAKEEIELETNLAYGPVTQAEITYNDVSH